MSEPLEGGDGKLCASRAASGALVVIHERAMSKKALEHLASLLSAQL